MPLEEEYREIKLTQGQVTLVDADLYEWLMQWKWYARWCPDSRTFYATRNSIRTATGHRHPIQMAREILGLTYGDKRIGDHRESTMTLDNRRSNLRIATAEESARNRRAQRSNKSGLKGIYFKEGKWAAQIRIGGVAKHLGYFGSKEESYLAYCKAAVEHHGEFARFS